MGLIFKEEHQLNKKYCNPFHFTIYARMTALSLIYLN